MAEAEKIRDEVWRDHAHEMVKRAVNSIEQQREESVPAEVLARHHALLLELARQDAAARAKRRYGLRQGQGQNS